ncbi:acyltransferase family protein [Streptomyces sp. NPDC001380]|uniref:acyltransferase family protein n=1 Tax=Streptomyces sp. NPDC001380 TaxID=3364566 RepID=UPI0036A10115
MAARNRYADLLRIGAVGAVVLGHWLLTDVTWSGGRLSGRSALPYVPWGAWATLVLQTVPVLFVVGGYAHAASWTAHRGRGEDWASWVRGRAVRLLWPTTLYVAAASAAAACAAAAGADTAALARAGWSTALHLWFLPVYLLLVVLTPLLHAAHRRWGAAVPAAAAAGAVAVDAAVLGPRLPLVGFANHLLVWGSMHQWGFAWQDGTLTRPRRRCALLAAGGAAALAGLLAWGPFPVDMVGAGARTGNTAPPSVALLAFAAAQTGLLLTAEPAVSRLLARPSVRRRVSRLDRAVMTVYLWHMVPVVVVAVALYPTGAVPQPGVGSARWWALRAAWVALLAALLVPLTAAVLRVQRPLGRLPAGDGAAGGRASVLLLCGLGAVVPALARFAVAGFAPGGRPPVPVLAAYACGFAAVLLSGRAPPRRRAGRRVPGAVPAGGRPPGPPRAPGAQPPARGGPEGEPPGVRPVRRRAAGSRRWRPGPTARA